MFHLKKKEKVTIPLQVPKHIGIIMDGNGRWAKKRLQPRVFGHKAGMEALQNVTIAAKEMGVQVLTVYAFSTERYVPELHKNNVKIQMIGDVARLPKATYDALVKAEELTKLNTGLILNFALNYGGRAELTQAIRNIAQEVLDAKFNPGDISEEMIGDYLQTSTLPRILRDPDLIIRTSGELRLSNFLPWQSAYSELYFTKTLWPDFNKKSLKEAIEEYSKRQRRFGGV